MSKSDVRRRTVLPQTLHGLQLASSATQTELNSDDYLDKMEEELNRRVDEQVNILKEGMAELVAMTDVSALSVSQASGRRACSVG